MELFALFRRFRTVTFATISLLCTAITVVSAVFLLRSWSDYDDIRRAVTSAIAVVNGVNAALLCCMIIVEIRIWLDCARVLFSLSLELATITIFSLLSSTITCNNSDIGLTCQQINMGITVAGWVVCGFLFAFLVALAGYAHASRTLKPTLAEPILDEKTPSQGDQENTPQHRGRQGSKGGLDITSPIAGPYLKESRTSLLDFSEAPARPNSIASSTKVAVSKGRKQYIIANADAGPSRLSSAFVTRKPSSPLSQPPFTAVHVGEESMVSESDLAYTATSAKRSILGGGSPALANLSSQRSYRPLPLKPGASSTQNIISNPFSDTLSRSGSMSSTSSHTSSASSASTSSSRSKRVRRPLPPSPLPPRRVALNLAVSHQSRRGSVSGPAQDSGSTLRYGDSEPRSLPRSIQRPPVLIRKSIQSSNRSSLLSSSTYTGSSGSEERTAENVMYPIPSLMDPPGASSPRMFPPTQSHRYEATELVAGNRTGTPGSEWGVRGGGSDSSGFVTTNIRLPSRPPSARTMNVRDWRVRLESTF